MIGKRISSIREKVLVLHVKDGYEERARNIEKMLGDRKIPFKYVIDGDKEDITSEVLNCYFSGEMCAVNAATSCALKHLYAYEYIIRHHLPGALVLEDDMILYDRFISVFNECMEECKERNLSNILISFEDSSLHFVPRSQRIAGLHLYTGKRDRFTGCYYISYDCAVLIMKYVYKYKCDLPIDRFHTALITRANLPYYWCHPTIATQGSHTGLYPSSISEASSRKRSYRRLTWKLKLIYKKMLYWLR